MSYRSFQITPWLGGFLGGALGFASMFFVHPTLGLGVCLVSFLLGFYAPTLWRLASEGVEPIRMRRWQLSVAHVFANTVFLTLFLSVMFLLQLPIDWTSDDAGAAVLLMIPMVAFGACGLGVLRFSLRKVAWSESSSTGTHAGLFDYRSDLLRTQGFFLYTLILSWRVCVLYYRLLVGVLGILMAIASLLVTVVVNFVRFYGWMALMRSVHFLITGRHVAGLCVTLSVTLSSWFLLAPVTETSWEMGLGSLTAGVLSGVTTQILTQWQLLRLTKTWTVVDVDWAKERVGDRLEALGGHLEAGRFYRWVIAPLNRLDKLQNMGI